jgi:SWI/SNF-related matrix-associated actin-dependent regulator of chromatin subfamily D
MVANPQYPPQPTAQQMQAQAAAEAQRREFARRQSKKPTDLDLPEGIEDITIGDAVSSYRRLREIERKLDATMMRKKLDMQDQTQRNEKRSRTMRIFVHNTADNQPWQNTSMDADAFDFGDSSQATYKVHIQGKLLPVEDGLDVSEPVEEGAEPLKNAPGIHERTKMSHFFKQINIEFKRPQSLQPDGMAAIEWKKPPPDARTGAPSTADAADFDVLRFERKSDENINVDIKLYRDENPERFKLSPVLAELIDTLEDDRPGVMYKLWSYIRANKLQENEDVRHIRCDAYMKKVCNL